MILQLRSLLGSVSIKSALRSIIRKRAVKDSVACKQNASLADKLFYLCWYFGKGRYGYSDIRVCEL